MLREKLLKSLELQNNASEDDIKKQFKKLCLKYHPDRNQGNKEAEEKFKEINAAYQQLTNPKQAHQEINDYNENFDSSVIEEILNNFQNPFHGFHQEVNFTPLPLIELKEKLSFKESVLGCEKQINYSRYLPCEECHGFGKKRSKENCKVCNGNGFLSQKKNNIFLKGTCSFCQGLGKQLTNCDICNGEKRILKNVSVKIRIPGGGKSGSKIVLEGQGHYEPFLKTIQNVVLHLDVENHPLFSVNGMNIHSTLNISLLNALKGFSTEIETIFGIEKINIKPKTKNNDIIVIPHHGVHSKFEIGDHVLHLNIDYPDNVDDLIKLLEKENN